jgi:hypothetical protein
MKPPVLMERGVFEAAEAIVTRGPRTFLQVGQAPCQALVRNTA